MGAEETVLALSLMERLLREENFSQVDGVLAAYEVDKLQPATLLGVLTLTWHAKGQLVTRDAFLKRVEASLIARLGSDRTQALLKLRR